METKLVELSGDVIRGCCLQRGDDGRMYRPESPHRMFKRSWLQSLTLADIDRLELHDRPTTIRVGDLVETFPDEHATYSLKFTTEGVSYTVSYSANVKAFADAPDEVRCNLYMTADDGQAWRAQYPGIALDCGKAGDSVLAFVMW